SRRFDSVRRMLAARGDGRADRAGAGPVTDRASVVTSLADDLTAAFGDRAKPAVALAPYTTFRVGGPADWLVETRGSGEIVLAVTLAARHATPLTVLGGGSNVLIADAGIRGLVIRPRGGDIHAVDADTVRADAAVTINGLVRWTVNHGLA